MIKVALLLSTFIISNAHAEELARPENKIAFMGAEYNLVFSHKAPSGAEIYEYTKDNEKIDNWGSLLTIQIATISTSPETWINSIKTALDNQAPKPIYSLSIENGHVFSQILFEPDNSNNTFETSIQKSFHLSKCNSTLMLQYSEKYPISHYGIPDERKLQRAALWDKSAELLESIKHSEWKPKCE